MCLAEHDDMVQAFAPNRTDQPFGIRVLPGRPWSDRVVADAHRLEAASEHGTIDTIAIADEVFWRGAPRKSLSDLARDPFGRGIGRHGGPHQQATGQMDDDQAIEQAEAYGRHHEQVDGGDTVGVIAQEGLPALRRRTPALDHVLGHG